MLGQTDDQASDTAGYFNRPAERLVLEGYRHLTLGNLHQAPEHRQRAGDLYADLLGSMGSGAALHALSEFVEALGRCATCPLKTYSAGSEHICRDEALVLGLIAGIQNGDREVTELCLSSLACRTRCDEIAWAAGSFAFILRSLDRQLLPIPEHVIRDVLHRAQAAIFEAAANSHTIH